MKRIFLILGLTFGYYSGIVSGRTNVPGLICGVILLVIVLDFLIRKMEHSKIDMS